MSATSYALAKGDQDNPLTQAFQQQVGQIQGAAQLANSQLAHVAQLHQFAAQLTGETLAKVDQLCEEAERTNHLTPLKKAALHHARMAYIFQILVEAERGGNHLIAFTGQ